MTCPNCLSPACDALDLRAPTDAEHQFDRELITAHASWRRANGRSGDANVQYSPPRKNYPSPLPTRPWADMQKRQEAA